MRDAVIIHSATNTLTRSDAFGLLVTFVQYFRCSRCRSVAFYGALFYSESIKENNKYEYEENVLRDSSVKKGEKE